MRKVPLITGHVYHIFNRGVNKQDIFFTKNNYTQFLDAAHHYLTKTGKFSYEKLKPKNDDPGSLGSSGEQEQKIEILAYVLMPNHFHFLIRQIKDLGVTSFMQHLTNSYSHYLNIKYKRVGPLFQGRFKNVLVESDEQLVHLSRYIHLNPVVSGLVFHPKDYPWSSFLSYVSDQESQLPNPKFILSRFPSKNRYQSFVLDQVDYAIELEKIKHLTFES